MSIGSVGFLELLELGSDSLQSSILQKVRSVAQPA